MLAARRPPASHLHSSSNLTCTLSLPATTNRPVPSREARAVLPQSPEAGGSHPGRHPLCRLPCSTGGGTAGRRRRRQRRWQRSNSGRSSLCSAHRGGAACRDTAVSCAPASRRSERGRHSRRRQRTRALSVLHRSLLRYPRAGHRADRRGNKGPRAGGLWRTACATSSQTQCPHNHTATHNPCGFLPTPSHSPGPPSPPAQAL